MERVINLTWRVLPTLTRYYDFPRNEAGVIQYRGLRGPEYMRALRRLITDLGVVILGHHPALELLRDADGVIAGARGVRRQHGDQPWKVRTGAVVLATGGTRFRIRGGHHFWGRCPKLRVGPVLGALGRRGGGVCALTQARIRPG